MAVPDTSTTVTERAPGVFVISVAGRITGASESVLMDAYGKATDGGANAVVLDFAELEYMNSSGIGLLVTLLIRTQRARQKLLAAGLTDHYREIFQLTRLDEAISIHQDVAAAVEASGGRS